MTTATTLLLFLIASDATPTAQALLEKYDAAMGPDTMDARTQMTAHRPDGSTRTYQMRMLKAGPDKLRIWFLGPAAVRGQEMLRHGDALWVYLPSLKKPTRMASRQSFQGGDFNNADVLRTSYQTDYAATVLPQSTRAGTWELALKAKTPEAAYARIHLWLSKSDGLPVRGEYLSPSGKVLRVAEFSEVKNFGGLKRPSRIAMKDALQPSRWSELVVETYDTRAKPAAAQFFLSNLGR
jgi:outer membrane lipoprotein-sorting protein